MCFPILGCGLDEISIPRNRNLLDQAGSMDSKLPELLAGAWSRGWGTLDADANNSLAPSSAHGEGKTAARAASGQSSPDLKRSPDPSPVPMPVQTSTPSSLLKNPEPSVPPSKNTLPPTLF